MLDFDKLPADEQQAIRNEARRRYLRMGGEDIDLAIKRHRKTLEQHDRELEHVSTLDFEKPYRWRIAPGVALRAEKALELQKGKRAELLGGIYEEILHERKHLGSSEASAPQEAPTRQDVQEMAAQLSQAFRALEDWKLESGEDSPPVSSAA